MSIKSIMLSASGGDPSIEIRIGQAQHGTYRVYIYDQTGKNPVMLGTGISWDQVKDVIPLGSVSELNQRTIAWEVLVSSAQGGSGQFFAVSIILRQGASDIPGGTFEYKGTLKGSKCIYDAAKMLVA